MRRGTPLIVAAPILAQEAVVVLPGDTEQREIQCSTGMATAAALFRIHAGQARELAVAVSLETEQVPGCPTSSPRFLSKKSVNMCPIYVG